MTCYGLKERDCNREIEKSHFEDIARTLGKDWRSLPPRLGMLSITKSDIDHDFKTEKEKRYAFFTQWKEMDGSEATYKKLIGALLDFNSREDAEGVCKWLQKSVDLTQEKQKKPLEDSIVKPSDLPG